LNLAFYPTERGPYNYVVDSLPAPLNISGINKDGSLKNPRSRWGGIMRKIETTNFESSNIEFIQFWMMDPFENGSPNLGSGGDLYFDLGDISEDVLRDDHKSFENGLPASTNNFTVGTSRWGVYPLTTAVVNAFDADQSSRAAQDVGLDGLKDADEKTFFSPPFLDKIAANPALGINSPAYQNALADPSSDDYSYYQSNHYTNINAKPLERYKKYNNTEGNSPAPPEVDGFNATSTKHSGC